MSIIIFEYLIRKKCVNEREIFNNTVKSIEMCIEARVNSCVLS